MRASRRTILVASVATAAAVALTGCSAGQVAETAIKKPSVIGVNADTADGSVAVRNLSVVYNGPEGYAAGADAPLEVALINETRNEIVVNVSSAPGAGGSGEDVVSARMVGLTGGTASAPAAGESPSAPAAEPSGEPSGAPSGEPSGAPSAPAAPAAQPARITLAPHSSVTFLPGDTQALTAMGLSGALRPGQAISLTFEFSNGAEALRLEAPVGVPYSPAPRGSSEVAEEDHEG